MWPERLAVVWARLRPQLKVASMDVAKALGRGAHFGVIAAVYNYMQTLAAPAVPSAQLLLPPEQANAVPDKPPSSKAT